jgi:hypothetical protein
LQFHCGNPPPAAAPSTFTSINHAGTSPAEADSRKPSFGEWKGSISFLKKRNKKLLFTEAFGAVREKPQGNQKFFASFFQKRSAFLRLQIASYKNDGSAYFFQKQALPHREIYFPAEI